mgnify:CR=1 FL=1
MMPQVRVPEVAGLAGYADQWLSRSGVPQTRVACEG